MTYLLDTCVISELVKKTPNPLVETWFKRHQPSQLYLSCITIAEIKKGLYKIKNSQSERYDNTAVAKQLRIKLY